MFILYCFFIIDLIFFWNNRKKLNNFSHNVWKGRLVSTVTVSFNTIMEQMIEMSLKKADTVCEVYYLVQFRPQASCLYTHVYCLDCLSLRMKWDKFSCAMLSLDNIYYFFIRNHIRLTVLVALVSTTQPADSVSRARASMCDV